MLAVQASSESRPASSTSAPGSVEGRVQNAITGDALPGATISLNCLRVKDVNTECRNQSSTSRPDGTFTFDAVIPGSYLFYAHGDGVVGLPGQKIPAAVIDSGQHVSGVVIPLMPQAIISGKVTDDAGNPEDDVSVEALTVRRVHGRERVIKAAEAVTSKVGAYTLKGLSPGRYYVAAHQTGKDASSGDTSSGAIRFYSPSVLSPDQATPIVVEPGHTYEGVNVSVRAVVMHRIAGKVVGLAAMEDKRTARLRLEPQSSIEMDSLGENVRLDPDGSFQINGVLPGNYILRLRANATLAGADSIA
jgi:hypothetical protein